LRPLLIILGKRFFHLWEVHWCTQKLEKEKKTQFVLGSVEDIQGLNQESIQEGMFFFFYSLFFGFLIVAVLFVCFFRA